MTTRARTNTPAKKTAAKKTTTRKPAAKKTPAKKTTTPSPRPALSLVKPAPAHTTLPIRPVDFLTTAQCHAVLAALYAGIPTTRIRDWRNHNDTAATRQLPDGSLLHYSHEQRTLTWQAECPRGAIHQYRITTPSTATAARVHAARCTRPHADFTHIPALTTDELAELGILHTPTRPALPGEPPITESKVIPLPDRAPRALADQLTHTRLGTADTQPLPASEIAAHIARTAAANDQPKEHPQP